MCPDASRPPSQARPSWWPELESWVEPAQKSSFFMLYTELQRAKTLVSILGF